MMPVSFRQHLDQNYNKQLFTFSLRSHAVKTVAEVQLNRYRFSLEPKVVSKFILKASRSGFVPLTIPKN